MRIILEVRKSYKFKLYQNAKRNKALHDGINIAGIIRNHAIALQRRDFAYQLAHDLCDHYNIMVFEDLNLKAMQKLWGVRHKPISF